MARQRMVTRTVVETLAEVMRVDITRGEVTVITVSVTGSYDSVDDLLKAVKADYEDGVYKYVAVQSYKTVETLYGMSEADFIRHAKVLPPR